MKMAYLPSFLSKCHKAMNNISNLTVFNHMSNLQAMLSKLPAYLHNKWREQANYMSNLQVITSFVIIASESANDPVFGKESLIEYSENRSSSTFASKWKSTAKRNRFAITLIDWDVRHGTNTNQNTQTQINANICICHLCYKPHYPDVCYIFLTKTIDRRRAFLVAISLCCLQKRTCNKCNRRHPKSLHMDNYQPSY